MILVLYCLLQGQFSLFAAKLGNQVIAVEPFIDSVHRLAKAALLENVQTKITLFHNAISNKRGHFMLSQNELNKGGLYLMTNDEMANNNNSNSVATILFDDLVDHLLASRELNRMRKAILKIDIEGHELLAFEHSAKLFKCMNIQVALMEWSFMKTLTTATEASSASDQSEKVNALIKRFMANGMRPFSLNGLELPLDYWNLWPNNFYWKKLTE